MAAANFVVFMGSPYLTTESCLRPRILLYLYAGGWPSSSRN